MSYCVESISVIWTRWLLWYQCTSSRGHYVSMLMPKHQDDSLQFLQAKPRLAFEVALWWFPYEWNANTSGVFPLVQCHGWEAKKMSSKVVLILGSPHQRIAVSWSAPIVLWDLFVELHVFEISTYFTCPSCLDVHASIRLGPVSIDTQANTLKPLQMVLETNLCKPVGLIWFKLVFQPG